MSRGGSLSFLLLLVAMTMAPPARADGPDPVARSTARKLGQEALKLYDAGSYAQALEKLSTANQLVPTPTLGLYAARCLVKLGRVVEASEQYLDVSRMPLERGAPAVMRKALVDAVAEREKLLPTIPTLEVALEGPEGAGVTLVVDGQPLLPGLVGEKRPVDPGHHKATAKRADVEVTEEMDVALSQAARLELKLPPLPPPPPPPRPPASATPPLRIAGWVGVGVGVVGAVVGGVSGAISVADAQSLSGSPSCVRGVCSAAEAGTIGSYHVITKLTTVGIVAGVAGLGFGIPALLLTAPPHERATPSAAAWAIEPWVGVGSAGFRGAF